MTSIHACCDGMFIGHALVSNFDDSSHMTLQLSESLLELKRFDGPNVLSRYLYLYHTQKYDLGETTKIVYESLQNRVQNESQRSPVSCQSFLFDQSIIDETAKLTDSILGNKTAGCGPASRSFPLALCHWIDDDDLFDISKKEATLTHHNRLAGEVAGIVNLICRSLLRNKTWQEAVQSAFLAPSLHDDVSAVCLRYGRSMSSNVNVHPAYAPRVLLEALQYVANSHNLTEALQNLNVKKNFYALPIIGVLLGARWGIPLEIFEDKLDDPRLKTIRDIANKFSREWSPENEIRSAHDKLKGFSGGCAPAQRSFPLGCCSWINENDLYQIVCNEANLTHFCPTAEQASGVVNLICRRLIKDDSWGAAVNNAFSTVPNLLVEIREIQT
ncbi:unnamed protein product [Rotaria magnacalcarata]|uniref:Uncharacterized protein n=2 Tax=Rotaria magnacalcarata TaxID=392030 RepID=A0A819BCE7_9BILA|nr:unnamed protein product [Rotaria magnacalcarata]CAF3789926.1 unnamed protein product [Rotaria magnacalcarata]